MNRKDFLETSANSLGKIYDMIDNLNSINLSELDTNKTILVILDVINGFVKSGSLYSPRNENLIVPISSLSQKCDEFGIKKLAFADTHAEGCQEFNFYPPHCIKGSYECKVVDEIEQYTLIPKNSTNGFLEKEFQDWLNLNKQINTFIIVGDCSDICVYQFATTLKAYFNTNDIASRIIVPEKLVNTFDMDLHNGDLMHIISLFSMHTNGIEIVKDIIA